MARAVAKERRRRVAGVMSNVILVLIILVSGTASQYAPGVMESVIAYRQTHATAYAPPNTLPTVDGFIAAPDCADLGETWYLRHNGVVESFLVVDCAGDAVTREWMLRGGIIAEVDGETARRWGVVGVGARVERVEYREVVGYE